MSEVRLISVTEHHLRVEADPLRLKIISEALGEYVNKHDSLSHDRTLRDFLLNMEVAYQKWYDLDEDDWGYTDEHEEEVGDMDDGGFAVLAYGESCPKRDTKLNENGGGT